MIQPAIEYSVFSGITVADLEWWARLTALVAPDTMLNKPTQFTYLLRIGDIEKILDAEKLDAGVFV